mmetsp:Transcript_13215/g.31762  ORF Transcript_13215/g.31762 Transcript_13215/m.31762 type:complete len:383 (-) Transcript_13215:9-1157(-)
MSAASSNTTQRYRPAAVPSAVKGLRPGAVTILKPLFNVLQVDGWESFCPRVGPPYSYYNIPDARAAAAAAALRRRFNASGSSCKDADVIDESQAAWERSAMNEAGAVSSVGVSAFTAAGVAIYGSCDGLTTEEAAAAFAAGRRVRALQGDAGDFMGDPDALVDALNGLCSDDAHAESALAMMLVGANLPPGTNAYFHCVEDDTIVQLADAFRPKSAPETGAPAGHKTPSNKAATFVRACCFWCRQPGVHEGVHLLTCNGCKALSYCSKACQTEDWKAWHRLECKSGPAPVAYEAASVTSVTSIDGTPLAGDRLCVIEDGIQIKNPREPFLQKFVCALHGQYDGWGLTIMGANSSKGAWVPYTPAGLRVSFMGKIRPPGCRRG